MHRPNIGFFYIENSGNIFYDFEKEEYINDLFRVILNQCIAYYFFQNGKMPLHASCISKNNEAYLISGPSGSGKSSIASLLSKEYKIISEDLSVIENLKTSNVYSSYPLIKLDLNMVDNSFDKKNKFFYEQDKLNRVGYKLGNKFLSTKKMKIKKCIFLNWAQENSIIKLSPEKKFSRIFQNCFKPIPYNSDRNSIKILLENISVFTKNVEIIEMNRVKNTDDMNIDFIKKILD